MRHGIDHNHREKILKQDRRHDNIYKHCRVLASASTVARYMHDDITDFTSDLTPDQVINQLLKHRLHEVEKTAAKKLKHPDQLVTIAARLTTILGADPSRTA